MEFYDLLKYLAKETIKSKTPLSIPRETVIAKDEQHEYLLYTGHLYQITPYMAALRQYMEKFERFSAFLYGVYPIFKQRIWFFISSKDKDRYYNIVKKAYLELKKKIDIGYNPDIDYYSGTIFYDLGMAEFEEYAKMIIPLINHKKLVTIDPHTTYVLKCLYKKVDPSFDSEIHHYSEFLSPKNADEFVDHESCYLNRYLELPNSSNAFKVPRSGKESGCCGGLIEFIAPNLAKSIAKSRVTELKQSGKNKILVWCPICLSNLSRVSDKTVMDVLELELV